LAVAVSSDFGHDQWVCAGVGGGILRSLDGGSTWMAQKELALLLGASDFLRKPVNRPDFLAALDCQIERLETKPS
jgi:hypothetical protein